MSRWKIEFTEAARKDLSRLDGHQRRLVYKAIRKVVQDPLPHSAGGYGIPLGNRCGFDLTGLLEIKLRGEGLRIIYELENERMIMRNIAIGRRPDLEIYGIAAKRIGQKSS